MDTRLLKRIESFYDSIKDKVYWISYQAKDTISETFPHILYGSGYECTGIKKSIMPLFLKLYRSKFSSQFFNLILFERKFCCPCLIYKDINTNINSINFNKKESSITISYKDHKLLDSFWKKTIDYYDKSSIVKDFYVLLDNILGISDVLPESELDFSNVENVENSFNLIIDKTLTSHIEVEGNLRDYGFSNDQVLDLFIGSFLYPWQSFIYQDLSDILGEYNTIQGGLTICYRDIYKDLSKIRTEYKSEIYELQHIILAEIWELNLLHRQDNALKSAKAAIMSRNMSHNLGSHVMFYIKQKLQSVSKIVDNKVLANIIPGELSDLKTIEQKIKENKDVELPFLVGLGRFINYLQERQDYIATVATDYIPARSTISFKDFVYDELKPELRYQRHHSEGSSSDAGWQSGNLLLDYIAYSEQYRKSEDIKVCFGLFNGTNPITNSDADKDFQALRKFNIAVPGGVIGRQAIFSIFENIIRNAAKHSSRRKDGKMVIELSLLKEDEDKKFKLDNVDNLCCKRKENGNEEKGQDLLNKYTKYKDTYHVLRIKIDMPNKEEDIDNLVSKLGERYVEADGSMLETSKGLKEMRISAAWLRGYSIDSEIPDDEPPVLSIYREPYEGNDYTLSYILCLPKPRKVAFVLNNEMWEEQWKDEDLNNVIKPFGCEVFVVEKNEYYAKKYKENDNIKLADIISDFEIVCMPSDYKNIICPSISSRYIADDGKIEEILTALYSYKDDEQKLKETIRGIYRIWFEATYPNSNSQLVIADEKAFKDKEAECKKLNEGKKDKVILKVASQMASKPDTSTQKTEDTKKNEATKDDCSDNIVFSTHFKGLEYDKTDYGQMMTASTCIEPITGNNSTARLIRQDEWNEEWQYKLLSSGLAKVAIFDERIFSSFISRESKAKIDDLVNKIKEIKLNKPENTWKKEFIALGIQPGHAISLKTADDAKIQSVIERTYEVKYWYEVAQKNHERRIYAFDISNVNEKQVDIIGYNVNIGKQVGAYPKHEKSPKVKIAQITYDAKDVKVELTDNGQEIFKVDDHFRNTNKDKGSVFDYITIHQGVLDKIYTAFGIKNDEDEKYKVTNAIHQCFSRQDTPTEVKKFLPNFIIHSGRSKPSKNDMPQEQPFVQFAAVDHAVKDCKYTLVELLASAHYEK